MPDDQGAVALLGQAAIPQLTVDLVDLVAVEGLAQDDVGAEAELVVDALAGGVGDGDDALPEGEALGVAGLQAGELGAGGVERVGVGLGQGAALLVEGLEVLERGGARGVEHEALALDGEDEDAEVGAPVADMVVAREVGAAELEQAGDGLADDDRAEVADVHLLRGVGRGVVDDDLAAGVEGRGPAAPGLGVGVSRYPGVERGGREAEVQEAGAGDLDLEAGRGEGALGLQGVEQLGGEGARVGLGGLGGGEDAVGLVVAVAGVGGGADLRVEGRAEGRHPGGNAADQGVELTGGVEPGGGH